jgi:hypothetical protein
MLIYVAKFDSTVIRNIYLYIFYLNAEPLVISQQRGFLKLKMDIKKKIHEDLIFFLKKKKKKKKKKPFAHQSL